MSCTYKERMFNLPATQQNKGPVPAASPVASNSSSTSSTSQSPLTNGGPSQIRLPPKKDFRSESEQQQLQQIQKVSPFPTSSSQSQAIRNADSPLDLSVKTRKRCADTTIFDYFLGGMSPIKRPKGGTAGVPPIPLDLTKTKSSPMKQMAPPAGMLSPAYATANPYAYKNMTPKAPSSSPSKSKSVKPSKGKEYHTIRSLPPDSVGRMPVGQPQQSTSGRQKLVNGYINFSSIFPPQPTAVGSAGLSPSSLMNKSHAGHGGDSRLSGSHQQLSHGLRELSAESVKSSPSQRGLTLFEQQQQQQQQQHSQATSRSHHIQQQQQQQYNYSQQRQLHSQQPHYQSPRRLHTSVNQRSQHTSQRAPPIQQQQQSTSSQRSAPPQQPVPPPHCQSNNPRLRDHDLISHQHRLQRLQQHYLQQQQHRQQQSPIHPPSSSSSLASPITISSPTSPSGPGRSSTPSSSSSAALTAPSSSSTSSSTLSSASSSRLLPVSVSGAYSDVSATSGAAGVSAKVFPFHQLEQSSIKNYDGLASSHKANPNVGLSGETMVNSGSGVEITSSGLNRYSPDSTDCTISGVSKRIRLGSDLISQQRHLHQSYQDQQLLSAQMYAGGIGLDKLANTGNSKGYSGYKTMPMSPYHQQQQLYMPVALQKVSGTDGQKKRSQTVGHTSMSKQGSVFSDPASNKPYNSAYYYQQQQRHLLMTASKYDAAGMAPGSTASISHHVSSPPTSYTSPAPTTTAISSSTAASSTPSAMASVQNIQKQKHFNSLPMKSPSRSSVDSNDDVKIIGSTPAPGSSTPSSNAPPRSLKEVPVINIISEGREPLSAGRGAAGNGQATGGRRMHAAIDYHHDPQEEAESTKRFNTPLSINIPNEMIQETAGMGMPSGKSDMISGKPVMTESRDPKLGSRKHIIMNAVNQDEALKKVFHVENGSGVSINPHDESLSEASFNSISPAPSPKMPILSPQHKNPPRMGSPSTSDPPPLEPSPATFLENPSPVSFVQENLSNNDQIVRPNLEIKRAPTNAAPQRPKPPIAYLQDPMFRGQFPPSVFAQHMPYLSAFNTPLHPYMQMIPSAEHSVHSAASRIPEGTVNAASGVPPAGMAATTKGVMESVREKREGFNVRSTARSKNIPVANVAPIVQAKNYRQNSTSSSSNGNSISLNSNTSSSLVLPLNAASSNSNSNSSDEVKIISGPNDGPCRSGGAGEKRRSKGGSNISGPGGRGDSSGNGGGLKEASGKISPTMPRTFFSPHNIISMFKNSKNEKIIESMCCDKNTQRGKMSLKDAINTLLEKHCKELHVETDQGEGSPSCLSSSSRSSDVEIIENPFERDDDPLITEFSNSANAANSNPHLLKNSSSTSTTSTITTTITNTTTFGTIVTSAINRATMSDCGRSTNSSIPVSYNTPKSQKPQQNTQLLLNKHQDNAADKDVIALSDDPEAPSFDPVDHTDGGSIGADVNMAGLGDIENEAHFNRLKQKLLRSNPADPKTIAEVPLTGFKKNNNNYKTSNPTCDVSGVDCSSSVKGRSGCDYLNDKSTKCLELSCDADVRESPAKSVSDTREHSSDFYPGSESFVTQRVHHCQEKKITPEDQNMVKNQPTKKQNLNEMFKQSRRKDKYSSEKRKSSGRRLAEELKRKAVMGAVVYQKTLYQEFNERTRIGRTPQEGENRMIMTRSSTQRRSSQRPRCRSSLRPRAARPERGALAEKDSEEEESLPGCWEIECSSPSLRLRRRRAGAISATGNSSGNNGTSHSKKRLMLTLHWRPRRASQNFCVSGRRKFRVVNRYASRHKRNVFGSQLPHSYNRQTLDWADVRRLPAPNRKNLPGRSSVTTMDDPYELRDEETESVASNSNSVSGSVPIPPEIRRIAINKNSGETILHRSARCGYEDVLLHCLQTKSVDVNARDNAGFTPLHECCVRGNLLIARYLITFGADVNQCSQDGIRPIHDAVENDHIEMARLLLSFGADPLLTTYSGKSPIKIARSGRMISLLKDHISDLNGEEGHEGTPWEFHGSWDLKEFDAKSGNPIFEDLPSDSEDSDSEDFLFDDCPLASFSLSSDIDKKYLSVPDIAFHTGKKLEKIREICEPNIFTMKYDDFVNDTQGLVCLQSTKARINTNKCDFVELLEADKYASVLTRISGRSLTDSNKASPQRESLTGASSKSGHSNNTKARAQSSSKFINEREEPPPKGGVALSPLSLSDDQISPLDKAESTYRAGSSSVSLTTTTTTTTTTKESVAQSERPASVATGSALPESLNLPEKSNLRNDTYDYHENANDTPAPSLSFKERFSGGQSKAGKKKRVALDTVLSRSKSATSTTSATTSSTTTTTTTTGHASSAQHNGHFTIKLGNLSDNGHKNYGIDQSARLSEHSGRSPRKTTKDASPSYTDNVDYAKKKKTPTDTSVVIDR